MEKVYINKNGQWELKKSDAEESDLAKAADKARGSVESLSDEDIKKKMARAAQQNTEVQPTRSVNHFYGGLGTFWDRKRKKKQVAAESAESAQKETAPQPKEESTTAAPVNPAIPKEAYEALTQPKKKPGKKRKLKKTAAERLEIAIEELRKAGWPSKPPNFDFSKLNRPEDKPQTDADHYQAYYQSLYGPGATPPASGQNPTGSSRGVDAVTWNQLISGMTSGQAQPAGPSAPPSTNPWTQPWDGDFSKLDGLRSLKEVFDRHGAHAVKDLIRHGVIDDGASGYSPTRFPTHWHDDTHNTRSGLHPLIEEINDKSWHRSDAHFPGGNTHDDVIKNLWDNDESNSVKHVGADGAWKRFQHEHGLKQPKDTDYGFDLDSVDWNQVPDLKSLHQKHGSTAVKAAIHDVIKGGGPSHSGDLPDHIRDEVTTLGGRDGDEAARPFMMHAQQNAHDPAIWAESLKTANRINRENAFHDFAQKNGVNPYE